MKKLSLIVTMVLLIASFAVAQRIITGTVADAKGEPMVGSSILVKGTATGTVTDIDGKFSLSVPADAKTLVISFAGYQSQEVTLGASNVINVNLAEALLQELVVTAIGIQRDKKSLGYSASDLKAEDIAQKSESDPLRALTAKVPGVNVVGGGGAPGQSTKINIRGISSLTGNTQPLFVVDGIPFDNSVNASTNSNGGTQFSNRAFDIDPNNIESMTILKGAAAAALYGSRATNGVVVISARARPSPRRAPSSLRGPCTPTRPRSRARARGSSGRWPASGCGGIRPHQRCPRAAAGPERRAGRGAAWFGSAWGVCGSKS